VKNVFVLNHAFIKKTEDTPRKEIAVSEQRKREYLKNKGVV
jgi:phage-related protein